MRDNPGPTPALSIDEIRLRIASDRPDEWMQARRAFAAGCVYLADDQIDGLRTVLGGRQGWEAVVEGLPTILARYLLLRAPQAATSAEKRAELEALRSSYSLALEATRKHLKDCPGFQRLHEVAMLEHCTTHLGIESPRTYLPKLLAALETSIEAMNALPRTGRFVTRRALVGSLIDLWESALGERVGRTNPTKVGNSECSSPFTKFARFVLIAILAEETVPQSLKGDIEAAYQARAERDALLQRLCPASASKKRPAPRIQNPL